ncbi:hypothetical protein GQ55_4G139200 [Panicum hallii var. hallii]|uniref:Uncharacterized protein n=1 Tax=Panicum hallii var. hallii TaxID=1504633 RepID=A0A2T7DY80_9POAL|nr:hypothetical protein GQ55_4G139200 [Panicum hallii var. hallii]
MAVRHWAVAQASGSWRAVPGACGASSASDRRWAERACGRRSCGGSVGASARRRAASGPRRGGAARAGAVRGEQQAEREQAVRARAGMRGAGAGSARAAPGRSVASGWWRRQGGWAYRRGAGRGSGMRAQVWNSSAQTARRGS